MRRRTIGSIFWGVTLVVIGGLLLARNLGYPIPIWSALARYWPVLIIGWGVVKLLEYFHYKRSGDNRPLFSGGEVALLILVLLAGSAITTAANVSSNIDFDFGDMDLWDITGNNYSYDEHHELPVTGTPAIDIVNMFGNVDIRATDSDNVVLDVRKTVRASSREEADRLSSDFTFRIVNDGSTVRIASSQDPGPTGGRRPGRQRFKSSLTVYVPKASPVKLDNRNGRVTVHDLAGNQSVTNRYGEVDVQGIEGDVEISNSFGSTTVRDAAGAINVKARYGEVRIELQTPPTKDVSLSMEFGDMRLGLPANSSFSIEARTAFGNVHSEFGTLPSEESSNQERSVIGRVGEGGPKIHLETRFGDIRLQKRG